MLGQALEALCLPLLPTLRITRAFRVTALSSPGSSAPGSPALS